MNIILYHHFIVARFCYQISLLSCLIHADFNKTLSKSKLKKSFINKSVTLLHFYLLKQIANHFLLSLFLVNFPANFSTWSYRKKVQVKHLIAFEIYLATIISCFVQSLFIDIHQSRYWSKFQFYGVFFLRISPRLHFATTLYFSRFMELV